MANEVVELLDALYQGNMAVDEVAEHFRSRSWPSRGRSQKQTYLDIAAADMEDPDPYIPGSYDDVVAAYDRGRLTDEQYAILANAIAQAIRTNDDNL